MKSIQILNAADGFHLEVLEVTVSDEDERFVWEQIEGETIEATVVDWMPFTYKHLLRIYNIFIKNEKKQKQKGGWYDISA